MRPQTAPSARLPFDKASAALRLAMCGLFALILALGGAGNDYPIIGGIVQASALIIMLLSFLAPAGSSANARPVPHIARLLIGTILVLLAIQIVPLPPGVWLALPGRGLAAAMLGAARIGIGWRSVSLDPIQSGTTMLELLPSLALLIAGCKADRKLRHDFVATFLLVALFSAILGAFQRVGGSQSWLFLYAQADAPGLFVNRNHQASFLIIAIPVMAYWITTSPATRKADQGVRLMLACGAIALFGVAVIATTSRAGFSLLALVLPAAALILQRQVPQLKTILLVLLPIIILIGAASQSSTIQRTLDRFSQDPDERTLYWANSVRAANSYAPLGSGLGTFPLVYPTTERHQDLTNEYVNNAHNDYVELWLEGGIPFLIGFIVLLGICVIGAVGRNGKEVVEDRQRLKAAALIGLLVLLLHSFVDYPLRMMSIMAVAGLLVSFLLQVEGAKSRPAFSRTGAERRALPEPRSPIQLGLTIMLFAGLMTIVWASALSQANLNAKSPAAALAFNPWSPDALVQFGLAEMGDQHPAQAAVLVRQALALSPLDAGAAALLIAAWKENGQAVEGDRLLEKAQKLGWREPRIQYALLDRANQSANDAATVLHADALLRTGNFVDQVRPFVRQLERIPTANAALVRALGAAPKWRAEFLSNLSDLDPADVVMHAQLLDGLKRTSGPARPAEIYAFLQYLVSHERYRDATRYAEHFMGRSLTTDLLERDTLSGLADGKAVSPFAWQSGNALGVVASPGSEGGIEISSARSTSGTVLRRLIVAASGSFAFVGRVVEDSPQSWPYFGWTLRCRGSNRLMVPADERIESHEGNAIVFAVRFDIPNDGCAAQDLELNLNSSEASATNITLKRLTSARR